MIKKLISFGIETWTIRQLEKSIASHDIERTKKLLSGSFNKSLDVSHLDKTRNFNALDLALDTYNLDLIKTVAPFYTKILDRVSCYTRKHERYTNYDRPDLFPLEKALISHDLDVVEVLLKNGASLSKPHTKNNQSVMFNFLCERYSYSKRTDPNYFQIFKQTLDLLTKYGGDENTTGWKIKASPLLCNILNGEYIQYSEANPNDLFYQSTLVQLGHQLTPKDHDNAVAYLEYIHYTEDRASDSEELYLSGFLQYLSLIDDPEILRKHKYELQHLPMFQTVEPEDGIERLNAVIDKYAVVAERNKLAAKILPNAANDSPLKEKRFKL